MFKMIAYISYPFLVTNDVSKDEAMRYISVFLAEFYRTQPNWVAVNVLYSTHRNPLLEDSVTVKSLVDTSARLIKSSCVFISLGEQTTEFSEAERAYAFSLGIPCVTSEEFLG